MAHNAQLSLFECAHEIAFYAPDDTVYRKFLDCVEANPGCAVYGYTGLLEQCAQLMIEEGRQLKPGTISAFWCTAEMLSPHQRELLKHAFGLPVRDFYGSRECPWMAAECEHGTRHLNPRYFVEALDSERRRLAPGVEGELAVCDLFNTATPLLRYLIGDRGAVRWQRCACGRNGLALTTLGGRTNDMIRLKSGRYLSSVFFPQVVKQFPGIKRAQLARVGLEHFIARYTGDLTNEAEQSMAGVISKICEGARAEMQHVDQITLTREGKLLPFVDERQQAE
jgi:phenylacetate-CoA ligase